MSTYIKYLQDNKEKIIKCINDESDNNYDIKKWEYDTHDDIFYQPHLLQTNFLKWCCTPDASIAEGSVHYL